MLRTRTTTRTGQVLPMMALFLFVLIGIAALTIDTGRGWIMKRELQRSADAAALAGAQYLPQDPAGAQAAASAYLAKNPLREGTLTTTKITLACVTPTVDCAPYNAIKVDLAATMGTMFGKAVNIDTMNGGARSIAMTTQPKKYDVMLVVDRTGSMAASSKMTNAVSAINTFLKLVDPKGVNVGMVVFPPAKAGKDTCGAYDNYSADTKSVWLTAPLESTYSNGNGTLNAASNLVKQVACLGPTGSTHYAIALQKAQAELNAHGRADADDVVIFLTDGAANIAPAYATADQKARPCGSSIDVANGMKSAAVRIFAIAYVVTDPGCLKDSNTYGANKPEGIDPLTALNAIATPGDYYYQPSPAAITAIFKDIAGELNGTKTRLRDDNTF